MICSEKAKEQQEQNINPIYKHICFFEVYKIEVSLLSVKLFQEAKGYWPHCQGSPLSNQTQTSLKCRHVKVWVQASTKKKISWKRPVLNGEFAKVLN